MKCNPTKILSFKKLQIEMDVEITFIKEEYLNKINEISKNTYVNKKTFIHFLHHLMSTRSQPICIFI